MKKAKITIMGMTCHHCEMRITTSLLALKGIKEVKASFTDGSANIKYDDKLISQKEIEAAINDLGYKFKKMEIIGEKKQPVAIKKTKFKDVLPIVSIILLFYFGLKYLLGFNLLNFIPSIDNNVSLLMIFVVGLMTSVHCIGMCGSINLAVIMGGSNEPNIKKPILYNLGRIISYTITGAIVGGLGSIISFNGTLQIIVILLTSLMMLSMGLMMLGWLPKSMYRLIPRMPRIFKRKLNSDKGPLYVGLLNGLMPCGPLQAMQIYALSTASITLGALSMFVYALGTVPLMLGFGILFIKLKGKYHFVIQRISAVLIILLALFMMNRAINLSGLSPLAALKTSFIKSAYKDYTIAQIKDGMQYVEFDLTYKGYEPIIVQKDIPVVLNIKVKDIRYFGCTNAITIPSLNLKQDLKDGDNFIRFTPTKIGDITYTCWMGMVSSTIKVVDNLESYGG